MTGTSFGDVDGLNSTQIKLKPDFLSFVCVCAMHVKKKKIMAAHLVENSNRCYLHSVNNKKSIFFTLSENSSTFS